MNMFPLLDTDPDNWGWLKRQLPTRDTGEFDEDEHPRGFGGKWKDKNVPRDPLKNARRSLGSAGYPASLLSPPVPRDLPRSPLVPEEDRVVEERSIERYLTRRDELLEEYRKTFGRVANTDSARRLFRGDGYKGTNSQAVHEASSVLSKDAWRDALQRNPEDYAVLYAGGSGAGKTSAIRQIMPDIEKEAAAVYDGNLSSFSSAAQRIGEAAAAGKKVRIVYVYRDPEDAWENGVIKRMLSNPEEGGRVVPMSVFLENTRGSLEVVQKMSSGGAEVVAVDNSRGLGRARLMTKDDLARLSVPAEGLRAKIAARTRELLDRGRITREQYEALIR